MRNNLESNSAMQNSGDLKGSPDSVRQNVNKVPSQQDNSNEILLKRHEKVEISEHEKADTDLINDLSLLGVSTNKIEKDKAKNKDIGLTKKLSYEDKIKSFKSELVEQGKSQTEILNLLISKFENDKSLEVWVENFKNFLKLHQFAQSKPPKEREAIQSIITKADFSSADSFNTSLAQISKSTALSQETKLELAKEFDGANIMNVNDMDSTLKEVKCQKEKIDCAITSKSNVKEALNSEIKGIESEIEKLPLGDSKRVELEAELEQNKIDLKSTELAITELEANRPKDISFELRKGVIAQMNPDGSRSIKLANENFSIKVPSTRWLFSGKRNIRAINISFPFSILRKHKIAHLIFPNMESNSVPTQSNRDMGHTILSSLGISDTEILSQEKITRLEKGLSVFDFDNGKTALENLTALRVYNVQSQSLNIASIKSILGYIKN